jgi:hypothetical protein
MDVAIINPELMYVNQCLVDSAFPMFQNQLMVDRIETVAERFEHLRGNMSYQDLSDAIFEKIGIRITPQAMHKWAHGGNIAPENVEVVCQFFNIPQGWFLFGGSRIAFSLEDVVNALPAESRREVLNFVRYNIERHSTELRAKDPGKAPDYLKYIDRLANPEER